MKKKMMSFSKNTLTTYRKEKRSTRLVEVINGKEE